MKKIILGLGVFFSLLSSAYSQEFSYGLKGGLNYSTGGEIVGIDLNNNIIPAETYNGESKFSFHGGAFGQINFGRFFIRPELLYTSLELEFKFPNKAGSYSVKKFDIPLLVGYNIYGPLDVYAGPSYSNILDASIAGNSVTVQNSPINAQIGIKVEFGRIGFDLRYEHNLSSASNEIIKMDKISNKNQAPKMQYGIGSAKITNQRINHIMAGVIFKLGGPGLNRTRKNVCY